jgi:hypothetical protein
MIRCAAVVIWAMLALAQSATAASKPAPDGCHWQALPELKAHLAVPDGWRFKKIKSTEALIYEVRPAGKGFEGFKACFHLEVRLRTQLDDVVARARAFVEEARATAVDPPPLEEQQSSTLTGFSCFVRYAPPADGTPALTAAVSSAANSRTGTIYTTRFEIPEDEQERIAPLGNALFREWRLDDEI